MTPPPRATGGTAQPHSHGQPFYGAGRGPGLPAAVHAPLNASYALPLPGPEWVGIRTEALWGEGAGGVVAMLDNLSPQVFHGGGFEDYPRPLKRGLPKWRGTAVPTLPLDIVLMDPTGQDRPVDAAKKMLTRLAGGLTANDPEPPRLILNGAALNSEIDGPRKRWVIAEPPAWDTSPDGVLRVGRGQHVVRQAVSLTFMLAGEDVQIASAPAPAAPKYRFVRAKEGDTYERLAKRELGEVRLAHRLARLNDATSVDRRLPSHKRVKLPTGTVLAEWRRDLKRG